MNDLPQRRVTVYVSTVEDRDHLRAMARQRGMSESKLASDMLEQEIRRQWRELAELQSR